MATDREASYFPQWKLRTEGVIAPDERLPLPQTLALGLQHVVAMFGSTVLAPLLMGFDPNVAILFSGIGTLIFFVLVGGRVPSYLGSSFAFIAVVIAATGYSGSGPNPNLGVALTGIIAAGTLYAIIGLIVMAAGYRFIDRLMPPVVTGSIVAVIGLNLAPIAVKGISGSPFDAWMGIATIVLVGLVAVRAPGLSRRLPVLLGGADVDEANSRAVELLESVGLGHRLAHKPGELSGGERQRAAVARALVNKPACVLGDEPTGNLDEKTAAGVFALMLELNRAQKTSLVLVTHDRSLARKLDRVLELHEGRLRELAPADV